MYAQLTRAFLFLFVVTDFGSTNIHSKHVPIMITTTIIDVYGIVLYYGKFYQGQLMR